MQDIVRLSRWTVHVAGSNVMRAQRIGRFKKISSLALIEASESVLFVRIPLCRASRYLLLVICTIFGTISTDADELSRSREQEREREKARRSTESLSSESLNQYFVFVVTEDELLVQCEY